MELTDGWEATVATQTLRQSPEVRDSAVWTPINVPGHWRTEPAFSHYDGPLAYRLKLNHQLPEGLTREWLWFDGIFYDSDVWVNETYMGATVGYFAPHQFEVTSAMVNRDRHEIFVDVACDQPRDRSAKRALTGSFQHSDAIPQSLNPGGLWKLVRLETTGPVAFVRTRLTCLEASDTYALVQLRCLIDSLFATTITTTTKVFLEKTGELVLESDEVHTVAEGENRIKWNLLIDSPNLWWPHSLGDQPLYRVEVTVADESEAVSDSCKFLTGLRRVENRDYKFYINGERLFLKGANYLPAQEFLADADADDLALDVKMARDAGLDFLRMYAHLGRDETYEAADRYGMLIWQDLPLYRGYSRTIRKNIENLARDAANLVAHHPSVFTWCAHNKPESNTDDNDTSVKKKLFRQLPTYNRTYIDTVLARALRDADPSRPILPNSGVPPHVGNRGSDSHLFFGWKEGHYTGLETAIARIPTLGRFLGAFGAQAVPDTNDFIDKSEFPHLPWAKLRDENCADREKFEEYAPTDEFKTFDDWKQGTQNYQARVVRNAIETMRRLKYRPAGGFAVSYFADAVPAISMSLLDHKRKPKAAWPALVEACKPVLVVIDWPDDFYTPGSQLDLDVHVISDLRQRIISATAEALVVWEGGQHHQRWEGPIEADTATRVGSLKFEMPDVVGPVAIRLELSAPDWPDITQVRHYSTEVVRAS